MCLSVFPTYSTNTSQESKHSLQAETQFPDNQVRQLQLGLMIDRYVGGETVPLGSGDVNFKEFFQKLNDIEYKGDLIIQGAREDLTTDIPTKETCSKYLEFINRYLEKRN